MKKIISVIVCSLSLVSCTELQNSQLGSIGSSLLGSSGGYLQGSDTNSLFEAGEGLVKAARGFSPEEVHYLGRGVAAMMLGKYKPYRSQPVTEYVNSVGLVLASSSPMPSTYGGYHFAVLDTNEVNAMSTPGGFVFVTRGLLNILPDEDALAGVLAHEVAHVALGHGVGSISQSNVTKSLSIIGKSVASSQGGIIGSELTSVFGDSVGEVFETLTSSGFSRSQEYDADELALEIMKSAGYNPHALALVMDKLAEAKKNAPQGGWFATHPSPEDRKDEIVDEIGEGTAATPEQVLRSKRFRKA